MVAGTVPSWTRHHTLCCLVGSLRERLSATAAGWSHRQESSLHSISVGWRLRFITRLVTICSYRRTWRCRHFKSVRGVYVTRSVREESLINLEQSLLIIYEQIKKVIFVFLCEVKQADPTLGQLSQPEEWLFEVFSLLERLVDIMEALSGVNFVLETSAHDFLPDLLNALNKEALQVISLQFLVYFFRVELLRWFLFVDDRIFERTDNFTIAGLYSLHIFNDLVLDIVRLLLWFEEFSDEFLKFKVLGRDHWISALRLGFATMWLLGSLMPTTARFGRLREITDYARQGACKLIILPGLLVRSLRS